MKKIYLDYAATTPVAPAVLAAMQPYFNSRFGNAGSLHSFGQEAMAALDESREKIVKTINADFREIIFTGSATEANNLVLRGVVGATRKCFQKTPSISPARKSRLDRSASLIFDATQIPCPLGLRDTFSNNFLPPKIIVSGIEHESILETARDLERGGAEIVYLKVDKNGLIDLRQLKKELDERTILVSVMYANNEIGTIQPIAEISWLISDFRIQKTENRRKNDSNFYFLDSRFPLFHTDAVQAFQYLNCDVKKLGVDLMTLSAHKIYGPKGVGALYARQVMRNEYGFALSNEKKNYQNKKLITRNSLLKAVITGGGQEFGLWSGTENIPLIVGFAKAVELAVREREKEKKRIAGLRDHFWKQIKKIYPKAELNGPSISVNPRSHQRESARLPNNLNIYFPGKRSEDLLIKFDLAGVAVSAGSACSARGTEPSHVLKACGFPMERIKSSLRITLGRPTAKREIDEVIKRLKNILTKN